MFNYKKNHVRMKEKNIFYLSLCFSLLSIKKPIFAFIAGINIRLTKDM